MVAKEEEYNASSLMDLSPHDHLLKRMGLTFGPIEGFGEVFSKQKNTAVREILDNALDEVRDGYGTRVRLKFFKDRSFEIQDSGRGIPVDITKDHTGRKVSGVFMSLGMIQSGGKFKTNSKRFSSGLNGVGASSTIHVSRRADVTIFRNKKIYQLSFKDGIPGFFDKEDDPESKFTPLKDLTELKVSKDSRSAEEKKLYPTGTIVKCWLRDKVFSSPYPYNDQDIIERLRGTAFLVPELEAEIYDELNEIEDPATGKASPQKEVFHFPDGISSLVDVIQPDNPITSKIIIKTEGNYIEENVPVIHEDRTISPEDVKRIVPIEIAFSYGDGYEYNISSFVNTINTKLGGVHEHAFERSLVRSFNKRFSTMRGLLTKKDDFPNIDDFKEGLSVVLSVQVSEPNFTSQSKEELSGPEVQKAIEKALSEAFDSWIASKANADNLQNIATKVVTAAKNRQRIREQRDLNRKKNKITSSSLPEKLLDCEMSETDEGEIYICEGDSAVDSLKQARDGHVNALLPIRGKIINAHKNSMLEVVNSETVQDIMKTLGAGAGDDFDIDKMRYGRVFITVDADPDGNSIATLLYALFWHLFRPVIEKGMLYKVELPLFAIATHEGRNSRKIYAKNDRERDKVLAQLDKKKIKYTVSRLKGLGEMEPEDLAETAINRATRTITQITAQDVEKVNESLELIFGKKTTERKSWISSYEIDETELL